MRSIPREFFFSRPADPRLGDLAKSSEVVEAGSPEVLRVLGYADDEGINNSLGRIGAAHGPNQIRRYFYKMTPGVLSERNLQIRDLGNIDSDDGPLEDRHFKARALVGSSLVAGGRTLTLGGGHDYGFPDAAAYCQNEMDRGHRPMVINFDAHMDVRPPKPNINSGTAFYRLLTEFPDIDFFALGLQSQCNNREQMQWLKDRSRGIVMESDFRLAGLDFFEVCTRTLIPHLTRRRSVFLSLDMDVFSTAVAPGCSQSWPCGLTPDEFLKLFRWILARAECRLLGIYEAAPELDVADSTSKLAASIAHVFAYEGHL